jgi:hypothetical protein
MRPAHEDPGMVPEPACPPHWKFPTNLTLYNHISNLDYDITRHSSSI